MTLLWLLMIHNHSSIIRNINLQIIFYENSLQLDRKTFDINTMEIHFRLTLNTCDKKFSIK